MAKNFSIMDMMSDMSREGAATEIIEKISIYDIGMNPRNEYEMSEIAKLKDSIYALGGVQQNVVLSKCPDGADHKYIALDGHRRLTACRELVEEGYGDFEYVPAVIKTNIDADIEDAILVMINSTQRNKSDWEKVMEHMKLKEIIPRLKRKQGLEGKTRALEAGFLGLSESQIAIYNTVGTKLHAELMRLLKNNRIGISLAYEAAKLEPELQEQLARLAHNNGSICEEDIRQLVSSSPIKGQLRITNERADGEKVPESDTFKEPEYIPPTDDEILGLYNHLIWKYDNDRGSLAKRLKEELGSRYVGCSGSDCNYQFYPKGVMLGFSGYITTYAELVRRINELVPIQEKVSESDTFKEPEVPVSALAAGNENVPESDVFAEPMAAVGGEEKNVLRGGYTLTLVDQQIQKYSAWLDMAVENGHIPNLVSEYNCLLDALELLRAQLA